MSGEEFVLMILLPGMGGWIIGLLIFCAILVIQDRRNVHLCTKCHYTFSSKPGECKRCQRIA